MSSPYKIILEQGHRNMEQTCLVHQEWEGTFCFNKSSSLFTVPSFPLLGLDMIWGASAVVYPLLYLPWCSTSSCFFPLITPGLLWPTYWPSTFHLQLHCSPKYAILIDPTFSNHLNLIFLIYVQGSPPHILTHKINLNQFTR